LSDVERNSLAKLAGVNAAQLEDWSAVRAEESGNAVVARQRLDVLNTDLAEQSLAIGEQTIVFNDLRLERGQWDFERARIVATRDDAIAQEDLISNIGAAVANNDPDLLRMYWDAYRNPNSLLGVQLRGVLGEDYNLEFERLFNETQNRFNLELSILRNDATLRSQAAQSGALKLQMQIELNPFETDALRNKYLLNSAQATMDLRNLPFTNAAEVFKSAASMAELVPSNFWDSLPSDLESVMRANGIRVDDMRAISEHAQFLAEKPGREFDWRAFSFIAEQGPPQTPEELDNVIQRAQGLLLNMGYSELVASAMVNTMQASWSRDEADLREGLLFVEGLVQPMELIDIQRAATTWSSLVSSLNTELGSLVNRVSLTGCATIANPSSLSV
jgi:hypothetical protein